MPDCCLNLLFLPCCGHMLPRQQVVFRVVTGKLTYCWALYARAVEKCHLHYHRGLRAHTHHGACQPDPFQRQKSKTMEP